MKPKDSVKSRPPQHVQTPTGVRRCRPALSAHALILLVLTWIVTIDNLTLWSEIGSRVDLASPAGAGYSLALGSLMVLLLSIPILLFAQRALLKPVLIGFLLLSGVLAYFSQKLGVVYDLEMVRNVVETVRDRNIQEGAELMSMALVWFLALTALPPILLVMAARVRPNGFLRDQARRVALFVGIAGLAGVLVLMNFKYVTYFSRENGDLQVYLNPLYPIKTSWQLVELTHKARTFVFDKIGQDAVQQKPDQQRIVGVMVVGETARADHFALNGYERNTTPELMQRDVITFPNATSCGTTTAYSVPCMFSFLNAETYSPEAAASQSNVLDVLESAGVKTVWVDSNSSCKGVCKHIENVNLLHNPDTTSPLFVDGAWHDEILLGQLDRYLDSTEDDLLLVLHSMGSHGPAYYRRYPESAAEFKPYCQSKAPQDCSNDEIVNAYDNTLVYTDQVLARLIDTLDARNDASFLLYASDHGESLGENGVYLHGLPRAIAPAAQSHVPVITWFSHEYRALHFGPVGDKATVADAAPLKTLAVAATPAMSRKQKHRVPVDAKQTLARKDMRAISHDHLSATLLGLYDVHSTVYEPALDLFPASDPGP